MRFLLRHISMKALRMGIYMHQHRLPRKGRGAGICYLFYYECEAFIVNPAHWLRQITICRTVTVDAAKQLGSIINVGVRR